MTNILELYREDVSGAKLLSVGGGREWRGPCPGCGGTDRFGVYQYQNDGEGSFYCGRGKGVGAGCGKGGDIIQYLRDFRGMGYAEACRFLGKEPKGGGGQHHKYASPAVPRRQRQEPFVPVDKDYPEEVVDPKKWQEKGTAFVNRCHEALLSRPMSIAYLMARGVGMDEIKLYRLGFHAGEERNGKKYQPLFRPWPSWGLRNEKKENGRLRCLKLDAGLIIPYFVDGLLHRITIRLVKPVVGQGKYSYVKGSIRDLFVTNGSARAFVTAEAELDCIAIDAAAGDLVGTIGIGSTGVRPDMRAAAALDQSLCILGALDTDPAGVQAGAWWEEHYPQYRRWPVPEGKDPGEAFQAGVDLRTWVMAGLPPALLPDITGAAAVDDDRRFGSRDPELDEFKQLLFVSSASFTVFGKKNGLQLFIPDPWKEENKKQAYRLRKLAFESDPVLDYIGELEDGVYQYQHVPGQLSQ